MPAVISKDYRFTTFSLPSVPPMISIIGIYFYQLLIGCERITPTLGALEKWFAKAFMNQLDSFEMGFPDLIKGKLKFYHFQEKHRRERLKEKNTLTHLLLNKTIRESVIEQFRQINEYEFELRIVVG